MASTKKNLKFEYDAFGRRIAKHVYNNETAMLEKSTYYLLDAQSNQLSVYEHTIDENENLAKFYLTERNIYGSSRLGTTNDTINMFMPEILPSYGILGNRTYELSNHLGNVLTTISDIKYPISIDNTTIDGYEVGINGISDYSPFGAPLDGRTVGNLSRRGFNSQERDNEVSGEGNSYTAEFWQYSPRLGRRWEIDPVFKEHESPYATFANNPIWFVDIDGKDTLNILNKGGKITRLKGGDNDIFQIVDKNKKVIESLTFDKGTLQYSWNYKNESQETDLPINVLQIKGNSNAESVFKMASTNTDVEWSFTTTKRGSSQNGFITTSHEKSKERGMGRLFNSKLIKENYIIYIMMHSHPGNTPRASGNGYNKKNQKGDGEWGDRGFAKVTSVKYEDKYREKINSLEVSPIMYYIFLPKSRGLVQFNENGNVE